MDNVRLAFVVALAFIALMMWEAWQKDYAQLETTTPMPEQTTVDAVPEIAAAPAPPSPRATAAPSPAVATPTSPELEVPRSAQDRKLATVTVVTDLFALTISTIGGGIDHAALLAYPIRIDTSEPIALLQSNSTRTFIYQSGLKSPEDPENQRTPNHHTLYTSPREHYQLEEGTDLLTVPLHWQRDDGVSLTKTFEFTRGSYLINVSYEIENESTQAWTVHRYEQLQRTSESSRQGMVYTFTGAALSTPEKRFEKFDYDDLTDQPIDLTASDAWVGVMQHYFVAALIPPRQESNRYYSLGLDDERYIVGYIGAAAEIAAQSSAKLTSAVFVGPKRHDIIQQVAPGLELTVDYGVLWFLAKPLFVVLQWFFDLTGNWGWAIVILTICLKMAFYPLSAAGYRSMANMRRVQPRLLALRDRYADDRGRLNQAMMDLYKEEKINPLGGCFPILIQIPVFIALYWVLLESVEMRQAPFVLWVHDLSEKDPFFVLPLLMGISMWLQQRLNPAPLDPTQEKVMKMLPFVFTIFFAFFPSGLVLYWLANNILSIAQQWRITRVIEAKA